MKNTLICPNCKKEIEISAAFEHDLREKLKLTLKEDFDRQLKDQAEKSLEKAKLMLSLELKNKENETKELQERNDKLHKDLLDLNKSLRFTQQESKDKELEMQKQLNIEKEKIEREITKKTYEEVKLKELEREKIISDLKKSLDEARQKATQGSQQSQGEILEINFEEELNNNFPKDEISEVKKGIKGADIVQIVKTPLGKTAGKIIWETKRTKHWEDK